MGNRVGNMSILFLFFLTTPIQKCPRLIPFSSKISKSIVAPTKSEHTDVHDPELKGSEKEREGYSKLVAKGAKGIVHMLREANKLVRSAGNHSGVVRKCTSVKGYYCVLCSIVGQHAPILYNDAAMCMYPLYDSDL